MRIASLALVSAILVAVLILPGCGGNPASPSAAPDEAGVSRGEEGSGRAHRCLGLYSLVIDTEDREIKIAPARSAELHVNVTSILNGTMGVSAKGVPSEHDPPSGLFVFDITLTHPFATRPQLAGFDVKGILITPGSLSVDSLLFADADEGRLENADGYTRWWNPTEFTAPGLLGYTQGVLASAPGSALTATVNPYKYFADVLSAEGPMSMVYAEPMDSDAGRGVFAAGSENTRRYRIRFQMDPGPKVIFGYAVDASWAPPSPNPPGEIPDDFPIVANQPEAYYINAAPTVSTLYYDEETGRGGGVYRLQMNVHDWQGQAAGNVADQVDGVSVYSPDVFSGGIDAVFLNQTAEKARYSVDLTGAAVPSHSGSSILAIRVGSKGGPTYQQGPAPAPSEDISAWTALAVPVQDPECVGDANNDWIDAVEIQFGDQVIDQLCSPTDYRDYYIFEIPSGNIAQGELVLWCDAAPTELELYDLSQALITEDASSAGRASIDLEGLDLMPGEYYIRVYTSDDSFPAPYLLEFTGELFDVTPSNPVDITPDGLYVEPTAVLWEGDYLYLSGPGGFWIYDTGVPSAPVLLSQERWRIDEDVAGYGDYIYYLDYSETQVAQLSMIDVSDPSSPVLHTNLIGYGYELDAIFMNSTHLYIATDNGIPNTLVTIYDWATDPMNPVEVGSFNAPSTQPVVLDLVDPEGPATYLIVGCENNIYAYNVEDPSSVSAAGSFACTTLNDIAVHDTYVCCVGTGMAVSEGLFILNQVPPVALIPMGSIDTPGHAIFIDVNWPMAYIGDYDQGLAVCDMTTPATPVCISSTPLVGDGRNVAVNGDLVCIVPDGAGFQIFDVSTPATPQSLFLTDVVNRPLFGCVIDDYLVTNDMGDSYWAIKTVDISDPLSARVVAQFPMSTLFRPLMFRVSPDRIGVVAYDTDWLLLDLSDPLNISVSASGTLASDVNTAAIRGDALYLARQGHLEVYDINPLPPVWQTSVSIPNNALWFAFKDNYMYISAGMIAILSVTNPMNPSVVGMYAPQTAAQLITVHGDYLYIAEDDRLEIADVSNPLSPSYVGSVQVASPPEKAYFVAVDGRFAYLSGMMDTLICNIWPPDSPTVLGPLDPGHYRFGYEKFFRDELLFELGWPGGIRMYDLY